jgi:hypothetical protein
MKKPFFIVTLLSSCGLMLEAASENSLASGLEKGGFYVLNKKKSQNVVQDQEKAT